MDPLNLKQGVLIFPSQSNERGKDEMEEGGERGRGGGDELRIRDADDARIPVSRPITDKTISLSSARCLTVIPPQNYETTERLRVQHSNDRLPPAILLQNTEVLWKPPPRSDDLRPRDAPTAWTALDRDGDSQSSQTRPTRPTVAPLWSMMGG